MMPVRYRSSLRTTVAASAAPYGYTLTIWTTGAILTHARGIPGAGDALLLLAGAVTAYALIGALAFHRASLGAGAEHLVPEPGRATAWGGLQFFSVGVAIAGAALVAHFVDNVLVWPIDGFVVTALYLLAAAFQLALVHTSPPAAVRRRRAGPGGQ
jgi:hypothetical protein